MPQTIDLPLTLTVHMCWSQQVRQMEKRERVCVCRRGWAYFWGSQLTCVLGFDGWKDRWRQSVRREVNRGMNCGSNRLEDCEQLRTHVCPAETSRMKPKLRQTGTAWLHIPIVQFYVHVSGCRDFFFKAMGLWPSFIIMCCACLGPSSPVRAGQAMIASVYLCICRICILFCFLSQGPDGASV